MNKKDLIREKALLNESQHWHLDLLVALYHVRKKYQGYPYYLALQDYFARDDGPEIEDEEFALVILVFSNYVLSELEQANES
ncbi:hypothetical protein [Enterococcus sp. DIV0385]|uniref:hypothetical protein n=1 Tax=Enterococcus sp. DIV0385 TaxID=2775003 RepID=UPI000A355460|nr:hypothetical protein A5852_000252 [Enterococcus faecium]